VEEIDDGYCEIDSFPFSGFLQVRYYHISETQRRVYAAFLATKQFFTRFDVQQK
jgi:hypothetical protein